MSRLLVIAMVLAFINNASVSAADVRINEFMADNVSTLTNSIGQYSDWIELYNSGPTNIDLTGWYLTDKADDLPKWMFPAVSIVSSNYLIIFASGSNVVLGSEIHTDIKLGASGEYLALVQPDGTTVVSDYKSYEFAAGEWGFPPQAPDISYGIGPTNEQAYFILPTPGSSNSTALLGFVSDTKFSVNRGIYTNAFSVAITSETASVEIYYTTNGSVPAITNGVLYTNPIPISMTTCLRAAAFKTNYYPSDVDTHTYLFINDVVLQSPNGETPGPGWPTGSVNGQVIDYGMDPVVLTDPRYTNLVDDALMAIPSISMVTDLNNLFGAASGIYVNASQDGIEWERPVSIEQINPDGSNGFQVNAGARIRGGASVSAGNPKHSFRIYFRSEYGEANLNYPLFGDEGVAEFDKIDFRTAQNYSWSKDGSDQNTFIRDVFSRDVMREMGQAYTRSRYFHLYINGQYWGLFQTEERPDANFAASYFGGNDDDYNVVKSIGTGSYEIEATAGNWDTYQELWGLALSGFSSPATYYQAQGLNTDLTRNPAYKVLLDIDNVAAYMICTYFVGDKDAPISNFLSNLRVNNFFAIHNRYGEEGFKFMRHDAEHSLDTGNLDRTGPFTCGNEFRYFNPQWLHQQLMANPDYKLHFSKLVNEHFYNNGAFTYSSMTNLLLTRKEEIDLAIIAESARWGDAKQTIPRNRDDHWLPRINYMINTYLPSRATTVLNQFRAQGWYSEAEIPVFSQAGGSFPNGFTLTITSSKPVYYTLDGSDPREPGTGYPAGELYLSPIPLDKTTIVKARSFIDIDQWSILVDELFVPQTLSPLRITEIMYHPGDPQGTETNFPYSASDYEFVELQNTAPYTIGLDGISFTRGVTFDFSDGNVTTLLPGEHAIVVRNMAAFTNRYPDWSSMNLAGQFKWPASALSDGGETIELVDGLNRIIASATYSDGRGWPVTADGAGHSLVPIVIEQQTNGIVDLGANWRASTYINGSPGKPDPAPIIDVVLNEIIAHTDVTNPPYDSNDGIEIYNTTGSGILLTNWYLSDSSSNLKKWEIPGTNLIAAKKWIHFDETNDFHFPITEGFGLDKAGEQVFLSYLPGTGGVDRIADCVKFKGQINGMSLGRYTDGADSWYDMIPTPGYTNSQNILHVVINEIMSHPLPTAQNPEDNTNDEYIEIYNPTGGAVQMWNADGTWRIDGPSYTFPSNTTIPAGGCILIVSFDPITNTAALSYFTNAYGISTGLVTIVGPYSGKLSNTGERIALESPLAPDFPETIISWIIEDEVIYSTKSPWPEGTEATGYSIERINPAFSGNIPANWRLSAAPGGSPGTSGNIILSPLITVLPCNIELASIENVNCKDRILVIRNIGTGTMNYGVTNTGTWMSISPLGGTCAAGEEIWHTMTFDTTNLPLNNYTSVISVTSTEATNSPVSVEAILRISYDDVVAPVIRSASTVMGNSNRVACVFSEPVEPGSGPGGGENTANYSIDNSISVLSAALSGDAKTVTLTTSGMSTGITYTITVNNVRDQAETPNTIATNSQAQFEHVYTLPVANAGSDDIVPADSMFVMNGGGSSDPDGGPVPMIYRWELLFGPENVTITNWNHPQASVSCGTKGTYIFGLTVSDGINSNMDSVAFLVTEPEMLMNMGSAWKYLDDGSDQGTAWRMPGFNDSGWASGPAQLGYGDGDEAQIVSYGADTNNRYITTYFRSEFILSTASNVSGLTMNLVKDDGAVIYLNGTEVVRVNMPTGTIDYTTLAASSIEGLAEANIFAAQIPASAMVTGTNTIAVEIHQYSVDSDDISFDLSAARKLIEPDADDDGMSDAWEVYLLGGTNDTGSMDRDIDGFNNFSEYVAGTDPDNRMDKLSLNIIRTNDKALVYYDSRIASGIEYALKSRFYSLKASSNLVTQSTFDPVVDNTNMPGSNITVIYTNNLDEIRRFFRVEAWLE